MLIEQYFTLSEKQLNRQKLQKLSATIIIVYDIPLMSTSINLKSNSKNVLKRLKLRSLSQL